MTHSDSQIINMNKLKETIEEGICGDNIESLKEVLAAAIDEFPNEYYFRAKMADILLQNGELDAARRGYEFMSDNFPELPWGELGLAQIEIAESLYDKAFDRLNKLLSRNEDFVPAHLEILRLHRRKGNWLDAQAACERVLTKDPYNAEASSYAAEIRVNANIVRKHENNEISQNANGNSESLRNLTHGNDPIDTIKLALAASKSPGEYENLLRYSVAQYPDDVQILAAYADFAFEDGNFEQAIERYKLLAERFDDLPWGNFGLAKCHLATGKMAQAEKIIASLLNEHKDFTPGLQFLSQIAERKNEFDTACLAWSEALNIKQNDIDIYEGYLKDLIRSSETLKATRILSQAREIFSDIEYKKLSPLEWQIFSRSYSYRQGINLSSSSPRTAIRSKRLRDRLQKTPLFDHLYYSQNKDDGPCHVDQALEHYIEWGSFARLQTCDRTSVARVLGWEEQRYNKNKTAFLSNLESAQNKKLTADAITQLRKIGIFVHSMANYYMRPIAECLCAALQSVGADAHLVTELDPNPQDINIPIVVAPHEFFGFSVPDYFKSEDFAKKYIAYNTEQLPSKWFKDCFADIIAARAVIDVSFQSANVFAHAMPSLYCFPPIAPSTWNHHCQAIDKAHPQLEAIDPSIKDKMGERPIYDERPLDIFFAGYQTSERDQVFTRNAEYFSGKACFLAYAKKGTGSVTRSRATESIFANNLGICGLSKIILNIHRFSVGYFEWERMLAQGFLAGACVVTTPSLRSPFFEPGVHYFEAPSRHLGLAVEWLLDTTEGRKIAASLTRSAADVLERQLTQERIGQQVIHFLNTLPEIN